MPRGISVTELRQLYDEQGRPLPGKGAGKYEVLEEALLHAASHVWIWRVRDDMAEILIQKRAAQKATFANLYDVSAAGHIDLGETPIDAALREAQEEIGLAVNKEDLHLVGLDRSTIPVPGTDWIENEFCWLYTLRLDGEQNFTLAEDEVGTLFWKSLDEMKKDIQSPERRSQYTPHGTTYFTIIFDAVERQHLTSPGRHNA